MKASLFIIAACFIAGTASSHAATTTIDLLEKVPLAVDGTSQINWLSTSSGSGWTDNIGKPGQCTEANLLADLNAVPSLGASTGWQAAVSNLSLGSSDISSVTDNGFNFVGRGGYGGEFVLLTVKLSDLGLADGDTLSSLSVSGTATGSSFGVSMFSYGADGVMTLLDSVSKSGTFSFNSPDISLSSRDSVYLLFSSSSSGAANTVAGLTMTATVESVPEPSSVMLLLPCALGAAALRRRKR